MALRRFIRNLLLVATLVMGVMAGLRVSSRPDVIAAALGLEAFPWANRLFDLGLILAAVCLCGLALMALGRLWRLARRMRALRDLPRLETGTIVVEFALVFPIAALILGAIVQLALIANASLVVRYAAFSAARAAIVSYERGQVWSIEESLSYEPYKIDRAAHLVLATISPETDSIDPAAVAIRGILQRQASVWGDREYHRRMGYARAASFIGKDEAYPPAQLGFLNLGIPNIFAPKEVGITVRYQYLITIPGISALPGVTNQAPAGVAGETYTIFQTVRLQSTGARQGGPAMLLGGSPEL